MMKNRILKQSWKKKEKRLLQSKIKRKSMMFFLSSLTRKISLKRVTPNLKKHLTLDYGFSFYVCYVLILETLVVSKLCY